MSHLSPPVSRPRLDWGRLWNMNLGFLGIQFGWGLQMANMSAIFEYLGANLNQLPLLWLAAPLTGLIVQPIIGSLSDNTWTILGRRRPYFLIGAIIASLVLLLMPTVPNLWWAAGLLWLLDTSANVCMVPFRAFIEDLLPPEQRTQGFAMQGIMLGLGAISASALPWILNNVVHISGKLGEQTIPATVAISFYVGGAMFMVTMLWTIITTPEEDPAQSSSQETWHGAVLDSLRESWQILTQMPDTMRQLARVQFFSWLGIFCFFLYFPPAVAHNFFGATGQDSLLYSTGVEWAGVCFAIYNGVCIVASFLLPQVAQRIGCSVTHCLCLLGGGIGLVTLLINRDPYWLPLNMIALGIAWSSVLIMPYAMLSSSIPPQSRGVYQGVFNFFIVLPEIFAALGLGWVMEHLLQGNSLLAVVLGGVSLMVAAGFTMLLSNAADLASGAVEELTASELTGSVSRAVNIRESEL